VYYEVQEDKLWVHNNIHYALTASVQYIVLCTPLEATAGSSLSEHAADLLLPVTIQK
jgi:hypothetical protein